MTRHLRVLCRVHALAGVLFATAAVPASAYQTDHGIAYGHCPRISVGTEAANTVFPGAPTNDGYDGLGGQDQINGGGGKDCVFGNFGNDTVNGGDGNDVVAGGPGQDRLDDSWSGHDDIDATEWPGTGVDGVNAGSGNDDVKADDGVTDTIDCGPGQDRVDADPIDTVLATCERRVNLIGRDVYHAQQWTGNPSAGGELVSEEWAVAGTKVARREIADMINTRTNVPCQDGQPTGPWCAEVRWRTLESQFEGAQPDDLDNFMQQRGMSQEDLNIDQIAELLDPVAFAAAGRSANATGPLAAILESWQVPPPGHGSTYEVFELTVQLPFSSGSYDPVTGEHGDGVGFTPATFHVWVDAQTRMPMRHALAENGTASTYYWSYDPAAAAPGAYPSEFFLVPPPTQSAMRQSVEYSGGEAPSEVRDRRTATSFAPYTLGDAPTVAGRKMCLITTLTFRQSERMQDDFPGNPEPDLWSLTRFDALYAPPPANGACRPGTGVIEDAVLTVASVARDSETAAAYRDSIVPRGTVVAAPRTPPPIALTADSFQFFEGAQNAAYTAPADGGGRLALADVGGTTVLINGSFAANEAANLLTDLEGR